MSIRGLPVESSRIYESARATCAPGLVVLLLFTSNVTTAVVTCDLRSIVSIEFLNVWSQMCLRKCMDLVKEGMSVLFFPEGTRATDGTLAAFKVWIMPSTLRNDKLLYNYMCFTEAPRMSSCTFYFALHGNLGDKQDYSWFHNGRLIEMPVYHRHSRGIS